MRHALRTRDRLSVCVRIVRCLRARRTVRTRIAPLQCAQTYDVRWQEKGSETRRGGTFD